MIIEPGDIIFVRESAGKEYDFISGYYLVTDYDGKFRIYVSPNPWKNRTWDYISTHWFKKQYNSHFAILKGEKILDKPLIV